MHKSTHIGGGETPGPGRLVEVSPSVAASPRDCVIIPFPAPLPPPWAGEDEDAGCWESIGVLAVRMVADFKRPRILVWSQAGAGEEDSPGLL